MRAGRDEFGYGVRECAKGVHVEDGEGVLAIVYAALGEDDGEEVDTGGAEER